MTTDIYVGGPTAWQRRIAREKQINSWEKRVATRQANRVKTISALIILSLIEGAAIKMGTFAEWLTFTGAVCIFINVILIGRLLRLWFREWQREDEIRKQANYRR